ncbi:nucleoside-diphosphate-sugar epimerase [Neobacillus sp. B4I6]
MKKQSMKEKEVEAMKVLVTVGCGFIGSNLVDKLNGKIQYLVFFNKN